MPAADAEPRAPHPRRAKRGALRADMLLSGVHAHGERPMTDTDAALDALIRQLVLQSPEHAVLLLGTDGRTRWGNDTACRLLGVTPAALADGELAEFFIPEERALGVPENEIKIARADSPAEDDRWQQRADGSRFWASGVLLPLRADDGRLLGFGKIFRNRSDIRLQMDTLRNQVDANVQAAEERGRQLARVAHELRNPLSPIGFGCHALRARIRDADTTATLDMIERQLALLNQLVEDLVEATVADADGMHLSLEVLSINAVLRNAAAAVAGAVAERGHQLDLLLISDALCVLGDAHRLQQVFVNLLQNAAKFTPPGGRIWLKVTTEGDECVARVEDNGIGLAPDRMGGIFAMFARADPDGAVPGLGIGLAVVKAVVERHGGTVQVESDGPGAGTKFTVRLPIAAPVPPAGPGMSGGE